MSYCSIEEAWGAPFDADPSTAATATASHRSSSGSGKPRRRRSRRASSSRNAAASAAYEGFANPPPPDAQPPPQPPPRVVTWGEQHWETPDPPHPDAHTRQFARELPSGQMPDALQVSLQGAPFEVEGQGGGGDDGSMGCAPAMTVVPGATADGARRAAEEAETVPPAPPSPPPTAATTPSPVIHEELDWMRNHLTHLTSQIETLSHKLDARATQDEGRTNEAGGSAGGGPATTTDAMLYVVTGAFALVLLDVLFRAGQRSVDGKA